ncbi:MAG: hypothetical protein GYA51_18615 [Candidatus Methanofastidiosa archaeon]|jgi:hypothetical protein|nr:hypothetical protein [Candidatus Methanofastidiosa archaeon]
MMPDFFTLKDIFGLLLVFLFEVIGLLHGISYYKTGKLFATFGFPGSDSADILIAIISFFGGSILFIFLNMMLLGSLLLLNVQYIILFSLHDLGLFIIIRRYLKGLEANQIGEAESE